MHNLGLVDLVTPHCLQELEADSGWVILTSIASERLHGSDGFDVSKIFLS